MIICAQKTMYAIIKFRFAEGIATHCYGNLPERAYFLTTPAELPALQTFKNSPVKVNGISCPDLIGSVTIYPDKPDTREVKPPRHFDSFESLLKTHNLSFGLK